MKYKCECVECGHRIESDTHCKDLKCSECGSQMRRAERPGPGQKSDSLIPNEALRAMTGEFFENHEGEISGKRQEDGTVVIDVPGGLRRGTNENESIALDLPEELRADLRATDLDDLPNEIEMSFSSEAPVMRYGIAEILSHEEGDYDFSRLAEVGAILKNHNPNIIIGTPTKVWLDKSQMKGRVRFEFGTTPEAKKAKREMLIDKSLRGTSVGYRVSRFLYLEDEDVWYKGRIQGPAYVAVDWEALEASGTPTAADPSVGVGRSDQPSGTKRTQEEVMDKKFVEWLTQKGLRADDINEDGVKRLQAEYETEVRAAAKVEPIVKTVVIEPTPAPDNSAAVRAEAQTAERTRISSITDMCRKHGVEDDKRDAMISEGIAVDQAQERTLDILANKNAAIAGDVKVVADGRSTFNKGAMEAMDLKLRRLKRSDAKHGGEVLAVMSLRELARECNKRAGVPDQSDLGSMVRTALRGDGRPMMQSDIDAFVRGGEIISGTTSDFPYILAATANKSMIAGYGSATTSYEQWCKIGSLSDFKATNRVKLSEAGDLRLILEGGKYEQTALSEDQNPIQVYTYGLKFNISRQAIINDDMSAFTTIPQRLGRTARRLPNHLAVIELLANSNMNDGNALFSTAHNNLNANADYALDTLAHGVDGIKNIDTLLTEQRGMLHAIEQAASKTLYMGLEMQSILVASADQAFVAKQIVASATNPSQDNPAVVNPLQNISAVIREPLLKDSTITGYSETAFYGVANPMDAPVIEVAFLNGVQEPYMEEADQTDADGRVFRVRLDCGAAAIDYAGMVKETGV